MTDTVAIGRRDVLRTIGVGAGVAAAGSAAAGAAAAQATDADAFEAWFSNVDNMDGVADRRGDDEVTVSVGAPGNGGAFGFAPAAVQVDPGTTVTWEWTGEGGRHDVTAADGSYGSELTDDPEATFRHTFETEGVSYYVCTPHETMGMKGAVIVGDVPVGGGISDAPEPDYGGWFDGVENFEGTVDATGRDEVRVRVGTDDGRAVFEPPAVRVDDGTTVVWEWAGGGDAHEVAAADGSFASAETAEAGHVFARTFAGDGIARYACRIHEGMRGAVVVGDGGRTVTALTPLAVVGGVAGGLAGLATLAGGLYLHLRESTTGDGPASGRPDRPREA